MQTKIQKIIVIIGPTASGKSGLAVSISKKFNGEVISADSRQVYRGMDIGTGKITKSEMRGVQHHLLDVADPKYRFSAENYRVMAHEAISGIISRGKIPIICGGTGFYIDAVLKEDPFPNMAPNYKLRDKLEKKSAAYLLLILKKIDPKRAMAISKSNSEKNNARRIIRAIEIASLYKGSPCIRGKPLDKYISTRVALVQTNRYKGSPCTNRYDPIFIGIKPDNEDLKKRILSRLLKRMKNGMVAEARRLHTHGLSWKRMEELGLEYRYLARYLQGKIGKEEFIEKLNTEIWHYARRQMTWFRRNSKIRWFDLRQENKINNEISRAINN